jgi:glycerol-3-phosphate acyltransferase PlsY
MTAVALAIAFFLGAVPWAYIVSRASAGVDIRTVGDGNVGARNTFKQVGHRSGVVVGLLDLAKGATAILLARQLGLEDMWVLVAGMMVVAGHDWNPFMRFQGGQGFAPTVGVMLALMPQETLIAIVLFIIVLALTRRWNLSSAVGFSSLPFVAALWSGQHYRMIVYAAAILSVVSIKRLVFLPRSRRNAARRRASAEAPEATDEQPEIRTPGTELR